MVRGPEPLQRGPGQPHPIQASVGEKAFAKVSLKSTQEQCSLDARSEPCRIKLWGALRPLNNTDQSPAVKTQSHRHTGSRSLARTTTSSPLRSQGSSWVGEHRARRRETFPRLRGAPWRPPRKRARRGVGWEDPCFVLARRACAPCFPGARPRRDRPFLPRRPAERSLCS